MENGTLLSSDFDIVRRFEILLNEYAEADDDIDGATEDLAKILNLDVVKDGPNDVITHVIFEKALNDHGLAEMCAKLIKDIRDQLEYLKAKKFQKDIGEMCCSEFLQLLHVNFKNLAGNEQQGKPLPLETLTSRRRMLGLVRFIGELYKLRCSLKTNSMIEYLTQLITYQNEVNLEALCVILSIIAKPLHAELAEVSVATAGTASKCTGKSAKSVQPENFEQTLLTVLKDMGTNSKLSSSIRQLILHATVFYESGFSDSTLLSKTEAKRPRQTARFTAAAESAFTNENEKSVDTRSDLVPTSKTKRKVIQSAGIMIYRTINDKIEYLVLLASHKDRTWSMPKGHVDRGEDYLSAAIRETKEEAGLDMADYHILDGFEQSHEYSSRHNKWKNVVCWAGQVKDPNVGVSLSQEHLRYEWWDLPTLKKRLERPYLEKVYCDLELVIRQNMSYHQAIEGTNLTV